MRYSIEYVEISLSPTKFQEELREDIEAKTDQEAIKKYDTFKKAKERYSKVMEVYTKMRFKYDFRGLIKISQGGAITRII